MALPHRWHPRFTLREGGDRRAWPTDLVTGPRDQGSEAFAWEAFALERCQVIRTA